MSAGDYAPLRLHGLGDVLREHRRSRPNLPAAVDGDLRVTYRELDSRVNRLATALARQGVGQGDRLLWLGQNSAKLMEVFLAGAKLGAVVAPANWRQSVSEVTATIADFTPKVIFWQETEIGEQHRVQKTEWQDKEHLWIQHDGTEADSYEALLASGEDRDGEAAIHPDLPVLAIYTAAFSGRPGAALLSHSAILYQSLLSARGQATDEETRYLVSGPMFHLGVLMGAFATFISGGCCIYVARIEPEPLLQTIAKERVTHGFIPQPVVEAMRQLNAGGRYDISSLFAAPDLSDWRSAMVVRGGAPLLAKPGVYGQTETMGMAVLAWLGGTGAGRPAPLVQVKILNEAGQEVPPGVTGEIAVRGALLMNGYYNRPEENAARTADGWHRTRDLGKRAEDGSIIFVGPKTTMIKSGIENIYPAEVETCIRLHPDVADVCIIGVPDPKWDQNVKAVIVLKPSAKASPDDIIEHCRDRMASYKKPKLVVFVDQLPRNATGFVDRAAVDAAHGGGGYPKAG